MAASLVVMLFSSLSSTIRDIQSEDLINWRNAALLASTVAPTSLMGMAISCFSADVVAKLAFATLLIVLTYPTVRGRPPFAKTSFKVPTVLVLVAGVGIGTLSGLVGIGGRCIDDPFDGFGARDEDQNGRFDHPDRRAGNWRRGAAGYVMTGFGWLAELLPLIVGSVVGAWAGVRLRGPLPDGALRIGFAGFMALVALRILGYAAGII